MPQIFQSNLTTPRPAACGYRLHPRRAIRSPQHQSVYNEIAGPASVAQSAEQQFCKLRVGGSIPSAGSIPPSRVENGGYRLRPASGTAASAPGTSSPKVMVESTRYTLTLLPAGRSICMTMASPRVARAKCEFPPRTTGNCRVPNGGKPTRRPQDDTEEVVWLQPSRP